MDYNYTLIIPHYNIPRLLSRLLGTVPKRDDLQVIVVDDCSTQELDELEKVRKDYNWVEWYSTGINGGGGKARNIGLDHAKGKYLIFADADDLFMPECGILWDNATKDDKIDISYFQVKTRDNETLQDEQSYVERKYIDIKNNHNALNEWLRYGYPEPWGKIIKTELVIDNKIKFQETCAANDILFSVKTGFFAKEIRFINQPMYLYFHRTGSVSNNQLESDSKISSRVEAYFEVEHFLSQNGIIMVPFSRYILSLLKLKKLYIVQNFCKKNRLNLLEVYTKAFIYKFNNHPFMK